MKFALDNCGDCCGDRPSNFRVSSLDFRFSIFDGAAEVWGEHYFPGGGNASSIFSIRDDTDGFIASGDRVRVELIEGPNNRASGSDVFSLREVEIYGLALPEPSSMALVALGLLTLFRRRRKLRF